MLNLTTSIKNLTMVGPKYAKLLSKLKIKSIEDLLYHIPFRYEDFSLVSKINNLQEGETVTIHAIVEKFENIFTKNGKRIQKVDISDATGNLTVIFFNQTYLSSVLKKNTKIAFAGTVKTYQNKLSLISPQFEIIRDGTPTIHSGRLVPIYPETEGISSKWLRSRISALLHKIKILVPETLPALIINKYKLLNLQETIYRIHFPEKITDVEYARQRLSFEELLISQIASLKRKELFRQQSNKFVLNYDKYSEKINEFINKLPFELTPSQKTTIDQIVNDLGSQKPMNRLLQGDVGSGKTIVAIIASYFSFLNGYQTLVMAPTEILARQHYESFKSFLMSYKIKISLLTSTTKPENKDSDIIVGTHAILFKEFISEKVALVIIDEQHRFGVAQRTQLRSKAKFNPHLLSMTATPIPRTIALTLYSELELSVINHMPKGRLPIKTFVVPSYKREDAYNWIKKELGTSKNNRVFIICPFIEESETLTSVKSAKKEFEFLKSEIFKNIPLGLIHGKMKPSEKEKVLKSFADGLINILVATPVVEVGIDIPQATIILIEASDRFGLSQLHQLRGRVGRGNSQSYCLLFTEKENSLNRLKILERHNIGIDIAEADLKLRGPGDILGTRQHGELNLKYSSLSDLNNIQKTQEAAKLILDDPSIIANNHYLQEKLLQYTIPLISLD